MRILHAISGIDPRNGGPTHALIGLAASQQRAAGLSVRVISTWQERDAFRSAEKLESLGVGVRMVGPASGKLSRHPDLRNHLEEEIAQADVVHVHAVWEEMQYRAMRTAQRLGKPYVLTPHGMLDPWNMTKSRLAKQLFLSLRLRRNFERASLIHYTTEMERDMVARLNFSPPAFVEPLGLDHSEFANLPPRGTFRRKHASVGDGAMILFLGRIHAGKGLEVLLPALALMKRTDAVLVVAGPDAEGYRAQVEPLAGNAQGRIIFTGMVAGEQKLAVLRDADVLALPSFHENFGLSVIEALAVGTPVVVSDQVYLHPELTRAGVGGVVPLEAGPRGAAALARELDRWLDDPELRREAGAKGAAWAAERFDWSVIARRWVEHYRRAAATMQCNDDVDAMTG
jgi:glycosyltransferase involved in cell wall biosynthesis